MRKLAIYAAAALISFSLGSVTGCTGEDPAGTTTADDEIEGGYEMSAEEGETRTTKSGLEITTIKAGKGIHPRHNSTIKIHYHGTLEDGSVFDSTIDRRKPATFPLDRLIKCWQQGIPMMREGGTSKLVCPPKLAYGKKGKPPMIPKNETLTFEIRLLKVVK